MQDAGRVATRPGTWAALIATWVVTRALVLLVALSQLGRGTLFNDTNLVWSWANGVPFGDDPAPALDEYPGAARLLALSGQLTDSPLTFGYAWVAAMLVVDLLLLVVLARRGPRAGWLWVLGAAALGPVVWLRYDLLVAAIAVAAVLLRGRRPGVSGVALGLAVLLKLWPLVVAAALLPRDGWRRWATAAAAVVAGGLLAEAVLFTGASVLSPLDYQSGRGLQIESLLATPLLWAQRAAEPSTVWEFAFRAYQLQGSASPLLDLLGLGLLLAAGAAVLGLLLRAPEPSLAGLRATAAALLVVTGVAVNTVFSPQYVVWFLPLTALAVAVAALPRSVDVVLVLLAALTQVVWPWGYPALLRLDAPVLLALTARNVLVVVLAVLIAVAVWRQARPEAPARPGAWAAQEAPAAQPGRNDSRT
jgi:hypothetical protein